MIDVDLCVFVVLCERQIGAFRKAVQIPECLLSQGCELYHEWQGGVYWDLDDVRFDMTTGRVCVVIKDDCLDDETDAADSLAKWPQIGFVAVN